VEQTELIKMVYRKSHVDCSQNNCQSYSAYIRVQKKWIKAGEYNSKCKSFTPAEDVKTYDEIRGIAFKKTVEQKLVYLEKLLGIKPKV